jgi:hypothetical protein
MPTIAIAGAPTTGKTVLAQYILKRLQDKGQNAQIVRNSVEDFFNKKYKENPTSTTRYVVDQQSVLSEQFNRESILNKTMFHVLASTLFCNYCTALVDDYDENEDLMEKEIPGIRRKALECAKNYDLIIFLEYTPSQWDYSTRSSSVISRYFEIDNSIKSFIKENEIKCETFKCSGNITIKERNYDAVRFVEKKFGLSRKSETEQNNSQCVSHETPLEIDDCSKKDQYLEKFWPQGFNIFDKKERIRKRKWNKR